MNNDRELIGRRLILNWGKLRVEISKIVQVLTDKGAFFVANGSDVVLANVYVKPDGTTEDEILGRPVGMNGDGTCLNGRTIKDYFTGDEFWMTIGEANTRRSDNSDDNVD